MWVAYCAFHLGDHKQAMEEYEKMTKRDNFNPEVWLNLACCYFFLGMYKEADESARKGKDGEISYQILQQNDVKKLYDLKSDCEIVGDIDKILY